MRSICIALPLPPKVLHPNGETNSWARGRARKKARRDACLVARSEMVQAGDGPWQAARWQAHYWFKSNRHRDEDGLVAWCKSYIDGIVTDAGLLPGDDPRYLRMLGAPLVSVHTDRPESVLLHFYEAEPAASAPTSNAAPSVSTNPAAAAASSPPSASRSRRGRS